jgi:hypothetical protein
MGSADESGVSPELPRNGIKANQNVESREQKEGSLTSAF